jgi:predicted RNA methylase
MIIKVSKDLEEQEIYANGGELVRIIGQDRDEHGDKIITKPRSEKKLVAVIKDPVLMTDDQKWNEFDPTTRITLGALFQSYPRITEYDGVSVSWDPISYPHTWCPSIDTLVFAQVLGELPELQTARSATEIGTGSGFLAKYMLAKGGNLEKVYVFDLSENAIRCAEDNISDDGRVEYICRDARVRPRKADIVICNPPYIPRPGSTDDNPYEGVALIVDLVKNKERYTDKGIVLTNASSLCWDTVEREARESGKTLEVLAEKTVPLKVNALLNNKDWLNFLIDEKGLKRDYHDGYEYWHTIRIIKV